MAILHSKMYQPGWQCEWFEDDLKLTSFLDELQAAGVKMELVKVTYTTSAFVVLFPWGI